MTRSVCCTLSQKYYVETPHADLVFSLQRALETNRLEAWEGFVRSAHGIVASAVYRGLARSRTPLRDQVDDLVQEVFLKLCGNNFSLLRQFRSDSNEALAAYLRTIAASVVTDSQRSRAAQKRGSGDHPLALDEVHPAAEPAAPVESIDRRLLLNRIGKCLARVEERDRHVFWLYYRHGLTARAIAGIKVINLSSGGVESLIRRLTIAIRKCLKIEPVPETSQVVKGTAE